MGWLITFHRQKYTTVKWHYNMAPYLMLLYTLIMSWYGMVYALLLLWGGIHQPSAGFHSKVQGCISFIIYTLNSLEIFPYQTFMGMPWVSYINCRPPLRYFYSNHICHRKRNNRVARLFLVWISFVCHKSSFPDTFLDSNIWTSVKLPNHIDVCGLTC